MALSLDDFFGIVIFLGAAVAFLLHVHATTDTRESGIHDTSAQLEKLSSFVFSSLSVESAYQPFTVIANTSFSGAIQLPYAFPSGTDPNSVVVKSDTTVLPTDASVADDTITFNATFVAGQNTFTLVYFQDTDFSDTTDVAAYNNTHVIDWSFYVDQRDEWPFHRFSLDASDLTTFVGHTRYNVTVGNRSYGRPIPEPAQSITHHRQFVTKHGQLTDTEVTVAVWR